MDFSLASPQEVSTVSSESVEEVVARSAPRCVFAEKKNIKETINSFLYASTYYLMYLIFFCDQYLCAILPSLLVLVGASFYFFAPSISYIHVCSFLICVFLYFLPSSFFSTIVCFFIELIDFVLFSGRDYVVLWCADTLLNICSVRMPSFVFNYFLPSVTRTQILITDTHRNLMKSLHPLVFTQYLLIKCVSLKKDPSFSPLQFLYQNVLLPLVYPLLATIHHHPH